MSQAKVDRHKEEKKDREKLNRKAKVKKVLGIFLFALILGAVIGFPVGKWIYNYKQEHQDKEEVFMSANEYEDWFNNYWVEKYSDLYTGSEIASTEEGSPTDDSAAEDADPVEENSGDASSEEIPSEAATAAPDGVETGDQLQ